MSKLYKTNMNIDVKELTPGGGMLMQPAIKEADTKQPDAIVDPRGFKERTGAEVFALISGVAINGANPKCSYGQLKTFQKIKDDLNKAAAKGEFISNKTDMDIIKNSINGNQGWPNQEEIKGVLDQIMTNLDGASIIDENPSGDKA